MAINIVSALVPATVRIAGALVVSTAFSPTIPPNISLAAYCNGTDTVDDTMCIQAWMAAGASAPGSQLYAPAGTYYYQSHATLYSGMHLRCADPATVIFRRAGGTGLFLTAADAVHDVTIARCGFDVRGATAEFLTVLAINPPSGGTSTNIHVRRNRVYDSAIMGTMPAQQRQYVLLLNCNNCRVDGNHLSEGGRIKLGRPGRELYIRDNIVERANDNAITVVDIGAGESVAIRILNNRVLSPKSVGIFFGADGESQMDPALTTRDVRISGNSIRGDWETACILGTLPARANKIEVVRNSCLKTGTTGAFRAGIVIKRTNGAVERTQDIKIERNRISASDGLADLGVPPLDMGGLLVMGNHSGFSVHGNIIRYVGPRAMYFNNVDIINGSITNNTMVGGSLHMTGSFIGPTAPNTYSRAHPTTRAQIASY